MATKAEIIEDLDNALAKIKRLTNVNERWNQQINEDRDRIQALTKQVGELETDNRELREHVKSLERHKEGAKTVHSSVQRSLSRKIDALEDTIAMHALTKPETIIQDFTNNNAHPLATATYIRAVIARRSEFSDSDIVANWLTDNAEYVLSFLADNWGRE